MLAMSENVFTPAVNMDWVITPAELIPDPANVALVGEAVARKVPPVVQREGTGLSVGDEGGPRATISSVRAAGQFAMLGVTTTV